MVRTVYDIKDSVHDIAINSCIRAQGIKPSYIGCIEAQNISSFYEKLPLPRQVILKLKNISSAMKSLPYFAEKTRGGIYIFTATFLF